MVHVARKLGGQPAHRLQLKKRLRALLLVCLLILPFQCAAAATAPSGGLPGEQAPPISLPDLNGQIIQAQWRSKPTVLSFGAIRCPYCREELPDLSAFAAAYNSRLNLHVIDIRESARRVSGYLTEQGLSLPVLLDEGGEVANAYGIHTIPTTLVVDETGRVIFRRSGVMSRFQLELEIAGKLIGR